MLQPRLYKLVPRLALLTAFCVLIEVSRMVFSRSLVYVFLPWNLVLAWIPLWAAIRFSNALTKRWLIAYLGLWFIFFPNAPYIITDFIHLKPRGIVPFWYDTILLYAFAFTGLLSGIISALLVFKKLKQFVASWVANALMMITMLISGYGIYMGRFLRYNSWNVLTDPLEIIRDTLTRLLHPTLYPRTYGVTLMAGALLCLVFFIFESFIETE